MGTQNEGEEGCHHEEGSGLRREQGGAHSAQGHDGREHCPGDPPAPPPIHAVGQLASVGERGSLQDLPRDESLEKRLEKEPSQENCRRQGRGFRNGAPQRDPLGPGSRKDKSTGVPVEEDPQVKNDRRKEEGKKGEPRGFGFGRGHRDRKIARPGAFWEFFLTPQVPPEHDPARLMQQPRIVIVGAGPAGSACALELCRLGLRDVQLFDKSAYPRMKACGSGLSPLALEMLGHLEVRDRFKTHAEIRALRIKDPGCTRNRLQSGKGAWVVPRSEFDHSLAQAAAARGARFRPETKILSLLRDSRGRISGVKTEGGEIEADLVVCADGGASRFAIDSSPRSTIVTIMGWWAGTTVPTDEAVMIWDRRLKGDYGASFLEPGQL